MYEKCIACKKEFRGSASGKCNACRTVKCKECGCEFIQKGSIVNDRCKRCRQSHDYKTVRIGEGLNGAI